MLKQHKIVARKLLWMLSQVVVEPVRADVRFHLLRDMQEAQIEKTLAIHAAWLSRNERNNYQLKGLLSGMVQEHDLGQSLSLKYSVGPEYVEYVAVAYPAEAGATIS